MFVNILLLRIDTVNPGHFKQSKHPAKFTKPFQANGNNGNNNFDQAKEFRYHQESIFLSYKAVADIL